jgi:hypothetical protein
MLREAADEISAVTDSAVPQWERSCRQALLLRNRPAAANAPDTFEEHLEATTALTPLCRTEEPQALARATGLGSCELDVCPHDAYCGQYARSATATKYPALSPSRLLLLITSVAICSCVLPIAS